MKLLGAVPVALPLLGTVEGEGRLRRPGHQVELGGGGCQYCVDIKWWKVTLDIRV